MLTDLSNIKRDKIIGCPQCFSPMEISDTLICSNCNVEFPYIGNIPAPILDDALREDVVHYRGSPFSFKEKVKTAIPIPDERVWSRRAKFLLNRILTEVNPDKDEHIVVNMGSGVEAFYKKLFKIFKGIVRIGIPHNGDVNIYGDAMALPVKSGSVDLFISSSVIEHLPNPEKAVSELFRTLKPGGLVYAEIPFIGAYHMTPYDYQRYTISGIEALFNRHGFILVEKGICSGPVNAGVLLFQHAIVEAIPWGPLQYVFRLILTWILHPIKYIDLLLGQSKWGTFLACNFFYLGRKPK